MRISSCATPETRARGVAGYEEGAEAFAERLRPMLETIDHLSANAVAKELAKRGIATSRGGKWSAGKVINLRQRLGLRAVA